MLKKKYFRYTKNIQHGNDNLPEKYFRLKNIQDVK